MIMVCSVLLAFLPAAVTPEAEGVSSAGVMKWIDACERDIDTLHGFVLLRHGKVVAEGSWKPYDTLNEPHFLSSHSKCFVSTAVGFLVDEGRLDLDERVIDILPDKAPANPSERLRMMRVRDLLTMNTGTKSEGWGNDLYGDWTKAALANEMVKMPGQQYKYDSGGTHVLGLIVSRRAKKPLMDFLKERLFDKVGIEKAWSTVDPQGNACAAWGFSMTTREISLLGQLHLNGGMWNGTRLLSEEWVSLATAKQTWTGKSPHERQPMNDWVQGMGFYWWLCQHGCYRADGAGGQYTIVFPKEDAVLSIHADVSDMQKILDVVWERLLPTFSETALPADAATAAALRERCASLALKPVVGGADGGDAYLGRDFTFKKAPSGLKFVRLDRAADGWRLNLTTEVGTFALPVGCGEWKAGEMRFSDRNFQALGEYVGSQRVAASGAVLDDGTIAVRIHMLAGPRRIDLRFGKKLFKPVVEGQMLGSGTFRSEW